MYCILIVIYYLQMEFTNLCAVVLIGLGFMLLYKTLSVFYGLSSVSACSVGTAGPLTSCHNKGNWQKFAAFLSNLLFIFYPLM